MNSRRLKLIAIGVLIAIVAIQGRGGAADPSVETEEDVLAKEVEDPTAILAHLKFEDLYTPQNYSTIAETNTLQGRPVLPIHPFLCLPWQQLIRPTLKLETLAAGPSGSTITEFADMQLFDLFISNWPNPRATGFGWGIGPTLVFPTGRVSKAGDHAWQIGPAAAAVYRGVPHLLVGFLWQEPMSFAYTNSSAKAQSQFEFQPLISYTLGHGWYVSQPTRPGQSTGGTIPRPRFRSVLGWEMCGSRSAVRSLIRGFPSNGLFITSMRASPLSIHCILV